MITAKTEQLLQDLSDVVRYDDNAMVAAVMNGRTHLSVARTAGTFTQKMAILTSLICIVAQEEDIDQVKLAHTIAKVLKKTKGKKPIEVLKQEKEVRE